MKIRYASIAMLLMLFLTPLLSLDLATVTAGASAMSTASAELPFDPTAVARASRNAVHTQGDTLVVDNEYRRVEFTAEGVRFAPREEGVLVPGHQVTYRLVAVRAGEHVGAAAAPVTPQVRENQVDYDRPAGVTERYVVDDRHVEQLFVLEKALTSGGDVAVIGQFETTLAPELVDPLKGIRFLDEGRDVVRYSGAVVYDAAGRETPAPLSLDGNQVTITVPGDWLAGAVYPVTIDPRLEGGIINVGNLSMDQNNPAVAYSTASGQYLVVFESSSGNGNILGRFVNGTTGALLGSFFYVAEGTGREAAPDVAYDAYQNRFLVVYEDGNVGSRNVAGRLVYGSYQSSGSQMPATEPTMIAGDAADEYDPAVAYNANDRQFAVVYLRSTYMVYGRMLGSGSVSPLLLSAGFQIWNHVSGSAHDPDVAWGSGGNTFLAAWHRERPPDQVEPDYIAIAYLYETYQGGGSQVYGTWTIAPYDSGSDPLTTDCSSPAVAYDPAANAYVVVFESSSGN
ncbi:MAG: hypothetical protein KJ734_13425, partial [Chloroflexi bacterium]|nr:hypothetical protein [Chloroflexota bacterium]